MREKIKVEGYETDKRKTIDERYEMDKRKLKDEGYTIGKDRTIFISGEK